MNNEIFNKSQLTQPGADWQNILVVDNCEESLLALELLLKPLTVKVFKAVSGKAALEMLPKNPFTLAIVSVQMREMDGFKLAELMCGTDKTKRIPILFVTAESADLHSIIKGYQAGAVDFLIKPLNDDIFRNKVSVFLAFEEQRRLLVDQIKETNRTKEMLRMATTAAKIGIWNWNIQANSVEWNDEHSYVLGYTEPIKQPTFEDWKVRVHPDDLSRVTADINLALQTGAEFKSEYRIIRPDGKLRHVQGHGSTSLLENARAHSMAGVIVDITERKESEIEKKSLFDELQKRSGLLQTILDQMPHSVIVAEAPSGRLIFANKRMNEVWGFPLINSNNIDEYREWIGFHPDGSRYQGQDWPLARAIKTGQIIKNEDTEVQLGDGSRGILRLNAAPVTDDDGNVIAGIVLAENVTEQKRFEKESDQTLSLLRGLTLASKDAIYSKNRTNQMTFMNPAAAEIIGLPEHVVLGKTDTETIGLDRGANELMSNDRLVMETARSHVFEEALLVNGEPRIYSSSKSPLIDASGNVIGIVGISRDITDQKTAENALRGSEARLRAILEELPVGVAIADSEGKITTINGSMREIWGGARHADLSQYHEYEGYWIKSGERIKSSEWALARAISAEETSLNEEIKIRSFDGKFKMVLNSAVPVYTEAGLLVGAIVVVQDITKIKQTEEDLKAAKQAAETANDAKTTFLANISHEIRTPLAAIIGFNNLLHTTNLDESTRDGYLKRITRNSEQLAQLINDLLDLTKAEANRLDIENSIFDPRKMIEDAILTLALKASEKNIKLLLKWVGEIPKRAISDSARIRQILLNIVGNAIKFTDRGSVTLQVEMRANENGYILKLRVSDTGIGLDQAQSKMLFQPFAQADTSVSRRFGGTGLGLALSKNLSKLLGGDLVLETATLGQGSVFLATVQLEKANDNLQSGKALDVIEVGAMPLANKRILVVDDSLDNRMIVSLYLKRVGAVIETAEDGQDALDICKKSPRFDVILMDLQMPRMDGAEALRKLREQGRQEPIIVLTAHAMKGERERCLEMGFNEYLSKPVDFDQLIQLLCKITSH